MRSPYLRRPDAPSLQAGPASSGFYVGLFLEHLEEASFLYEQRISLLTDPELTWRELDGFEERLEAHIDALVVGDDLALDVCRQQMQEGDFGECYAAIRVACRRRRWDIVEDALGMEDEDDADRWGAIRDALCHEAPGEWAGQLARVAAGSGPAADVAAATIGYRRLPGAAELLSALQRDERPAASLVRALGRLRHRPALAAVAGRPLRDVRPDIRLEAGLACLWIGEAGVVSHALSQPAAGSSLVVALGGGPTASRRLLDRFAAGQPGPDDILALGLLGDPAAIPALLQHLHDEALAERAAMGLHLITGAELFETVDVPVEEAPEPDDDEAGGEAVSDPPATVPLTRLLQDPAVWAAWWDENRRAFADGTRYRAGEPASPAALIATLRAEHLPTYVRQLAGDELAIRYGCDVRFEADMFVADQERAMRDIDGWLPAGAFQPGAWYFAGRRVTV